MRYNGRGELLAGVGGPGVGILSIDRVPIGPGEHARWFGDDLVLASAPGPDGIYRLYQYRRATGWRQEHADDRGATRIAAGRMNLAVLVATQPTETVYGFWNGGPLPAWVTACHPLDGHPDDRLIFASPEFLQLGILHPSGQQEWFATGSSVHLDSVRLVDGGFIYQDLARPKTLIWQDGATQRAIPLVDDAYDPMLVLDNGSAWVLYHNTSTYLQLVGTTRGYRFPGSYAPAIAIDDAGLAHVAITPSANEAADTISLIAPFRLGEGAIDLADAPPPEPVPITPILRAIYYGWFHFSRTPDPPPPQNCGVYAGVDSDGYIRLADGTPVGQFFEDGANEDDLDRMNQLIHEARARDQHTPTVPYFTYALQQGDRLPDSATAGVEAFWRVTETEGEFEARVRTQARRFRQAWLFGQCYTSNDRHIKDLRRVRRVLARILASEPNVIGILNFSGSQRKTGYQDHPEVWPDIQAEFDSVLGVPPLDPAPPPVPDPDPPVPPAVPLFRPAHFLEVA